MSHCDVKYVDLKSTHEDSAWLLIFAEHGPKLVTDIRIQFGERLRALRLKQEISQEKLAEAADLHRTYVSSVERGERNISLENIARLAEALNVKIREFFPT